MATLVAGFFTFGATWGISDLLWIEIFIEAGIGGAVAWREYEKGNNVAGTFSIVTAMLPMLKVSKWFRGIDANEFKILSETLANSGLSKTSTVKDYVEFYKDLNLTIDWRGDLKRNDKIRVIFQRCDTIIRNYNVGGPWRGSGFESGSGPLNSNLLSLNDNITKYQSAKNKLSGTAPLTFPL